MLVTTCAHCQARFRVTPPQLNARQGQVRCGRCHQVFNGFQQLERFPDDDTGARLLAEQERREREEALKRATEPARRELPKPEPEVPESVLEPPLEPPPAAPVPPPAAPLEPPAAPAPAASPLPEPPRQPRPPRRAAVAEPPPPPPEPELFLELPPRKPVSRAWSFGVVLMLLVLLAELAFAFRGPVAQRYPLLRPALEAACAPLQCSVPYAREDGLLKLEHSEMLEVPGKPQEIALGARVRNLASVAQEYPHLELTLTDNTGQPAARRVLRPTDYLGRPLRPGEVIGPGAELALQIRLETPRIKPTGYELLLFYP